MKTKVLHDTMKCNSCGFENKSKAKFCSRCGQPLNAVPVTQQSQNNNSKIIIAALIVVIAILAISVAYLTVSNNNMQSSAVNQPVASQSNDSVSTPSGSSQQSTSSQPAATTTATASESKDWVLIGSYSGSGSGSQSVSVPAGEIMIKLSAYPIKNYATNHLYVTGSNGESSGVDWGSTSDVETRSNSLSYTSSSPVTFTIDYYETVSWQVDFYRYQ